MLVKIKNVPSVKTVCIKIKTMLPMLPASTVQLEEVLIRFQHHASSAERVCINQKMMPLRYRVNIAKKVSMHQLWQLLFVYLALKDGTQEA